MRLAKPGRPTRPLHFIKVSRGSVGGKSLCSLTPGNALVHLAGIVRWGERLMRMVSQKTGHGLAMVALVTSLFTGAAPTPAFAQNDPAPVTYHNTCLNAQVSGGTLYATCPRSDGTRYGDTKLDNFSDCLGDIANHDGQLYCEKLSHNSGAVAAGAVVGALIGLAIAAGASSKSNSGNNVVSAPMAATTQTQRGYHTSSADNCGPGVPIYLAFRMGGDPNNLWPVIVDKGSKVDFQLPQGTTQSVHCGTPPGPADAWVYPTVH